MTKKIITTLCIGCWLIISAQSKEEYSISPDKTQKQIPHESKEDNSAYSILQEVWKRKKKSTLEQYQTYQYEEYEKIEFSLGNKDSIFVSNYNPQTAVFLNTYNIYGQNTPKQEYKQSLISQRQSDFQEADTENIKRITKRLFRDINIHQHTFPVLGLDLQNPTADTGSNIYHYTLLGTSILAGEKCYRIEYNPKRKDILQLRGLLYISQDTYSVVKITLQTTHKANENSENSIYAELDYFHSDNGHLLPYRNFTEINLFTQENHITAKRTILHSKHLFNIGIPKKVLKLKRVEKEVSPHFTTDIAQIINQIKTNPKHRQAEKASRLLTTGYYNVGSGIEIGSLYSAFGFNEVEGTRIRLGARTYFSPDDKWKLQGYGAYGFRDQQLKYGAEALYMFNPNNRLTLGISTRRDILQLGVQSMAENSIMLRPFASSPLFARGENSNLSNVDQTHIFASVEPIKNFQIRIDGRVQHIQSANATYFNMDYYQNNRLKNAVKDSHISLSLTAKPRAKYRNQGVERYEHSTNSPTFVLKYTRGIEDLLQSDFGYHKLQFRYTHPIMIGTWGRAIATLEAGKNFSPLPLALQNVIPANQSYTLVPNTFSQLHYYEFVADQYATLHLEHHFNGKILSQIPLIKKLKLREVAIFRTAVGSLSEDSKDINAEKIYSAPSKHPYYEYGFGIENIGLGNFRMFRVDFNWRGNYLNQRNAQKFGIKAGVQLDF